MSSVTVTPTSPRHDEEPQAGPVLSDRDAQILAFERKWWRFSGAKEQAIFAEFGVSATRYYQALNRLLDTPEAVLADPVLVLRLRRLRSGFVAGAA